MKSPHSEFTSLLALVEKRIGFLCKQPDHSFFKGHITYLQGLRDETEEVAAELEQKRQVYLEDELGDVFWDYLCLIETLAQEGHIDRNRVFARCLAKFSERISPDGTENLEKWETIKQRQKKALEEEYNKKKQK